MCRAGESVAKLFDSRLDSSEFSDSDSTYINNFKEILLDSEKLQVLKHSYPTPDSANRYTDSQLTKNTDSPIYGNMQI